MIFNPNSVIEKSEKAVPAYYLYFLEKPIMQGCVICLLSSGKMETNLICSSHVIHATCYRVWSQYKENRNKVPNCKICHPKQPSSNNATNSVTNNNPHHNMEMEALNQPINWNHTFLILLAPWIKLLSEGRICQQEYRGQVKLLNQEIPAPFQS